MRKIAVVFMAFVLAASLALISVPTAKALDFTCNRQTEGQVRVRLFDYYDKNTAIYTQCMLPDDGYTWREDFILQGYPNNQAKSAVARASGTIKNNRLIIVRYYDGLFTNQLAFQVLNEGFEHWFNFDAADSNKVSSVRVEYY